MGFSGHAVWCVFPINKKTCKCQWMSNRVIEMGLLISQAEECDTGSSGTSLPRCWFILFVKLQFGMTVSHLLFPQLPSAKVTCSNLPSISLFLTSLCHFSSSLFLYQDLFSSSLDSCVLSPTKVGPVKLLAKGQQTFSIKGIVLYTRNQLKLYRCQKGKYQREPSLLDGRV